MKEKKTLKEKASNFWKTHGDTVKQAALVGVLCVCSYGTGYYIGKLVEGANLGSGLYTCETHGVIKGFLEDGTCVPISDAVAAFCKANEIK